MAGFSKYLRFIIRRERLISSLWIGITVIFTAMLAALFPSLLGDTDAAKNLVEMLKSPAMVSMTGPVYGTEAYTVAISFSQMMSMWVMITMAVMNIFFVCRHTRSDEEQGRLEMIRSLPIGHLVNSAATVLGALILNLLLASLTCIAVLLVGFEGCSFGGALAYSFQIASFGFLFAAITLLCAQLFSTSHGASGSALAILGIFYLMRIAGDYTDNIISYISPMGLGLRVFAFYDNNIYPFVIQFIESIVFILIAFAISTRRDIGEGIIPARKGRGNAKKSLLSPLGFSWRLTKNPALIWCAVIFIIGAMYGSMLGDSISEFINNNDFYKQLMMIDGKLAASLEDSYIAMILLITAHIAVIPIISIAGKLRSEESRGRLEQIFARSVKRIHLISAFIFISFITSAVLLFCAALGLYTAGISIGSSVDFVSLLMYAMSYLPAMWVFAGMSILLTGVFPQGSSLVWVAYAYSFLVVYLGKNLSFPDIFNNLSPFNVIPQMPVQEFNPIPLIVLSLLSALFAALGSLFFNKRDLV